MWVLRIRALQYLLSDNIMPYLETFKDLESIEDQGREEIRDQALRPRHHNAEPHHPKSG